MSALNPIALLNTLTRCGVDFVLVGALAVNAYVEARSTGDVDVMVPRDDERNRRALERALTELGAELLPAELGGAAEGMRERYPTYMFRTRHGKLDVLYHPDGSPPYAKVKDRAIVRPVGGVPTAVVAKDDLVRMKLAAGRPHDLADIANLTDGEHHELLRALVVMPLAPGVDEEWATDLAAARASMLDPDARVWTDEGHLKVDARTDDLIERQLEGWARALADRLHGAEVLAAPEAHVQIERPKRR